MAFLLEGGVDRLLAEDGRALYEESSVNGVAAGTSAVSGVGSSICAAVGSASGAGTATGRTPYNALAALPQFSSASQAAYWLRPGSMVVRDNQGAHDLVVLGHTYSGGSNAIHLATSVDQGATWAWTAAAANLGLGTLGGGDGMEYAVQDSGGALHCTFKLASGSVYYFRVTLTRDVNGHVTGITSTSTALDLTSLSGPSGGDYRAAPHIVFDATPAERLLVTVFCDGANNGQYVYLAKASTLTPTALSDFSDLSGTASTMSLALNQTSVGGGAYDHAHGLAQLGSTKDLYISCASVVAEAAPTVETGVAWVRLTASGSTWTVGSTNVHAVSGGAWFGGMVGRTNDVLVGYIPCASGTTGAPTFRSWNSGGTLSDPGYGSPTVASFASATTSFMTFNALDDGRIWTFFTRDSTTDTGGWGTFHCTAAFFNTATWTTYGSDAGNAHGIQANAQSFAYGLSGIVDQNFQGIVGVQSNCQGANFSGYLYSGSLLGGDVAVTGSVGTSVGVGTATGVGASLAPAVGSSAGAGTAAGVGAAVAPAVGTSAGVGTPTGIGAALDAAVGSSAGTGAAAGTANALASSVGTAAGTSTATGVAPSGSTVDAVGTAAGSATAAAVGVQAWQADGFALGQTFVTGFTNYAIAATGTAAGTSTVTGFSPSGSTVDAVGTAAGTATVTAVGVQGWQADGFALGQGFVTGFGTGVYNATGTAAGVGSATGTTTAAAQAAGSAVGTGAAAGSGVALALSVGTAGGAATVTAVGFGFSPSVGTSAGAATVSGVARAVGAAAGTSAGTASVSGVALSTAVAVGAAAGTSTALAYMLIPLPPIFVVPGTHYEPLVQSSGGTATATPNLVDVTSMVGNYIGAI